MTTLPQGLRTVLVVEDDPHLSAGLVENLRAEGYVVHTVADGRAALDWLRDDNCDLVVLDVMLPHIDGYTVCRTMREKGNNIPVLFLTARGDPQDRILGLEAGGDDYLAKPFHLQELLLRVRAILRRREWYQNASTSPADATLRFGGNEVDFRAFRGRSWNGATQELTEKEAMILKALAEHPGEIVSREDLLERVGLRRVPLDSHRGQFYSTPAQAFRARSGRSASLSHRVGRGLPVPHRGRERSPIAAGSEVRVEP